MQQYVSVTPPVVPRLKWLRNTHSFTYLSVQRHAIHSSSTLRCASIKWVRCIIWLAKPSCFLCPPLPACQQIPFHSTFWPKNYDLPKINLQLRKPTVAQHILTMLIFTNHRNEWYILLTSPGLTACCSFSTDTSHDQASCSDKTPLLPGHS